MRMWVVCVLSILGALGCSGDDSKAETYAPMRFADASSGSGECTDADDDGTCAADDCDDNNPDVALLCCVEGADPTESCPCIEGTESVWCNPNEVADRTGMNDEGEHGVFKCSEGARFCRDEQWSACEGVSWVFSPS